MPPSAVFDTNILVSARLSDSGKPFRCLELARRRLVQSVTCDQILREFQDKLVAKFEYDPAEAQAATEEVRAISRSIVVPGHLHIIAQDPTDDVVVECAVLAAADYVVTGDHHLLAVRRQGRIEMLSAAAFLNKLPARF